MLKLKQLWKSLLICVLAFAAGKLEAQCSADFTLPASSCQFNNASFTFTGSAGKPRFAWDFGDGFSNNNTDTVPNPVHQFNRDGLFTVTLIVTDTGGCTDTVTKNIRVLKKPVAAFSTSQTCADLATQFTSSCTSDSMETFRTFLWFFGDGGTDYNVHPQHTYISPGNKTVTLYITTWNGCMDTLVKTVQIFDRITLTISKDSACKGDFVSFSANPGTGSPGTYHWNFGNGFTTYASSTSHQYNTAGTFTPVATLYYSNGATCIKAGKPVKIHELPDASFTILDSVQCFNYNRVCIQTKASSVGLTFRSISFDDGFVDKTSPLGDTVICYNYPDSTGGTYTLSMTVIDKNGCMASYISPVKMTVYPELEAGFLANPVTGCFNTSFYATNTTNMSPPKVTGFKWDFGDDSTNTSTWNPISHTYTTDGVFDVTLIVQNSDGCIDTFSREDLVTNTSFPIDARLDSSTSLCRSDNLFMFRQSPITGGTIYWDFDNLDTSFIFNPDYHYARPGMYIPKVNITKNGCSKLEVLDTIFVYGPQAAAGRIVNQFQCSIRDTVIFHNTSTYYNNRGLKFFWDFGDPYASSCVSDSINNINVNNNCRYSVDSTYVKHMYSPGQENCYLAKLIVTDTIIGCTDTAEINLPLIKPNAKTGLQLITNNLCLGPEPEKAVELDLSMTKPGCDQETFKVMWDSACARATSYFDSFWMEDEMTHNYPYELCDTSGKITIGIILQNGTDSNDQVCSDTGWYHYILDYGKINPSFSSTYNPSVQYCKNSTFTFTVDQPDQDSLTLIRWDWGDGTFQTATSLAPVSHTYTRTGLFRVYLYLELEDGCLATDSMQIRIGYRSSFTVSDREVCLGEAVQVAKNISYWNSAYNYWNDTARAQAGLESVKWDFGDGNGFSSTNPSPSKTYTAIGDYTIRMAVTDSVGCKDTFILTNAVRVFGIDAEFTTVADTFTCAQLISFESHSTVYDSVNMFGHTDDRVLKHNWNFGQGLSGSILKNPTKFFKAGTYSVKLLVENTRKCKDSLTKIITVLGPTAWYEFIGDSTGCQPLKVRFKNTSLNAGTYTWTFGDANNSSQFTGSDSNMSFTYPQYGIFYPRLTAYMTMMSNGIPVTCSNTYPDTSFDASYRQVTVFENPKPQFAFVTDCNTYTTTFTNQSIINTDTIVRFEWEFGDGDTSTQYSPQHQYADTGRYKVVLKAYSSLGCYGEISQTVIIAPFPVVYFQKTNVCLGTPIHFKDSTESFNDHVKQWVWDFDDGTTSLLKNPIKTYLYDSVFDVSLTVTNYAGCKSSDTITVRVHSRPKVNFTFTNKCLTESIPFTNTTTSKQTPVKYFWNLGNGDTSTSVSLSELYDSAGDYSVKLRAVNPFGCDDSVTKIVTTYPLPQAGFTINNHEQCLTGSRFVFTDNSSIDTGQLSYNWDFGDSTTASVKNPVKNYTKAGIRAVWQIAITAFNCRDTAYDTLLVNPNPVTTPFLSPSDSQCINSQFFHFADQTTILSGTYTRKWDLGDLTVKNDSAFDHRYKDTGNYVVKLMTMSDKSCPDTAELAIRIHPKPKASFTVNNPIQCQNTNNFVFTNTSAGYYGSTGSRWFFGDGDSSSYLQGVHHYNAYDTFTVRLIATNTSQCSDTTEQTILVNPLPVADFSVNDSLPCEADNLFLFTNQSNIAYGTMSYKWDFGDSDTAGNLNTSHSYDTFGIYTVSLMTLSDKNCRDTMKQDIEVFPMPVAEFSVNDQSQCLNDQNFIFTNLSHIPKDSFMQVWLLGENDTATVFNPQKQFSTDGVFRVGLKIISDHGCRDSAYMDIRVHPKPEPSFTVNDSTQCINGQNFIFSNTSVINTGSMTHVWDYGNGTTDTTDPAVYTYPQYGPYTVTLTLYSDSGCVDSISKPAVVFPKPSSAVSVNDTAQCENDNTFIFHAITGIPEGTVDTYYWNLDSTQYGPGNPDTSRTYTRNALYKISLIAESAEDCRDTSFLEITVHPKPTSRFIMNDSAQCVNDNLFVFTDQSYFDQGALTYSWDFGDGTGDTARSPQKIYAAHDTLQVTLIPATEFLCRDTFTSTVIIFPKPEPAFAVNDSTQCLSGNRFIVSNNSGIPYGTLSYSWETGDGLTYNNLDTGHVYDSAGRYRIMLRVLSSEGCADSTWQFQTVHPTPVPAFTINNPRQCLNDQSFVFTNNSSISNGSLTYSWDLGDGTVSGNTSVTHVYSQHGIRMVKLKAISAQGCIDSMSKSIRIFAKPLVSFNINNSNQCVNIQKLVFNSTSSIAEGAIGKYYWDFDDGSTDSGNNVSHFFSYSRFYTVRHRVVSDSFCVDSAKQVIRIFPKPEARFTVNDSAQCLRGNLYTFTDQSYDSFGLNRFDWNMAGKAGSGPTVNHSFADTGYKTVTLVVTSVNGCRDTAQRQVYVKRMPDASFSKLREFYCQFDTGIQLVPLEPGGNFSGKNLQGNRYRPVTLWKDTVMYGVTVNGCYDSSFQFTNIYPAPEISLGNDTQLCLYEIIELKARFWGSTYKWGNSSVSDTQFVVSRPGTYFVTVTNICGEARDTIRITYTSNNCRFYIPTAFTPNGDDNNQYFKPYLVNVPEMRMQIYNRWGEKVYDGDQDSPGWDGTYMGQPVQQDVYTWVVFYRYRLSNKWIQIKEKGTLQLLR